MDPVISFVAKYFILLPVIGIGLLFFRIKPGWRLPFVGLFVVSGVLAYFFSRIGSHLFYDPRPFVQGHFTPLVGHARDNGFPSDHTLLAAWLAFLSMAYSRKLGYSLLLVALLVGVSRMAAGVHHSWDILGSFVFAALAVYVGYFIVYKIVRRPKTIATAEK